MKDDCPPAFALKLKYPAGACCLQGHGQHNGLPLLMTDSTGYAECIEDKCCALWLRV